MGVRKVICNHVLFCNPMRCIHAKPHPTQTYRFRYSGRMERRTCTGKKMTTCNASCVDLPIVRQCVGVKDGERTTEDM